MNDALGNVGATVDLHADDRSAADGSTRALADARQRHERRLRRAAGHPRRQSRLHRARRSELRRGDAEGRRCASTSVCTRTRPRRSHWHICEAHYLESWSDVRADDGTVTIIQPLIAPLYGGKSAHEVHVRTERERRESGLRHRARPGGVHGAANGAGPIAASAAAPHGTAPAAGSALLRLPHPRRRRRLRPPAARTPSSQFVAHWRKWLHDGVVPDTAFTPKTVTVRPTWPRRRRAREPVQGLDVVFTYDPTIHDGRFANNAWLQETAQVADEADVGQRGPDRSEAPRPPAPDQWGRRRVEAGRAHGPHPGVARARPGARHAHAASRLRTDARRPRGQRHRLQRQRAADAGPPPTFSAASS